MIQLNQDTKEYLKRFRERGFTENDFVGYLISLLHQNGIVKLDERKLEKKLWYYYKNPKYRELFQDVPKARCENAVSIGPAIHHQMYFCGSVFTTTTHPFMLFLTPDENKDLSVYEQYLSNEGISLMKKMVKELAVCFRVEKKFEEKVNIYHCSPNQSYCLVDGRNAGQLLSSSLITDGTLKTIDELDAKELENCFFDNPIDDNSKVKLYHNFILHLCLQDASYAVLQGFENCHLKKMDIHTEKDGEEELIRIANIAREVNHETEILYSGRSNVRRKILK